MKELKEYLDTDEAADYYEQKGVATTRHGLENMRWRKTGPRYTKVAGKVRYRREWLDEYALKCAIDPEPALRIEARQRGRKAGARARG